MSVIFTVKTKYTNKIINLEYVLVAGMTIEKMIKHFDDQVLGYTIDGVYIDMAEQEKRIENEKADRVYVVKKDLHSRYITSYRAVFIENGELKKEDCKTQNEAKTACVTNGRKPKRVEILYSLFSLVGELPNGETFKKVFKYLKDAEKCLNSISLENPKIIKIA